MANFTCRLKPEIIPEIFRLHTEGKGTRTIAMNLGIARTTVQYHLSPTFRARRNEWKRVTSQNQLVCCCINGITKYRRVENKQPRPEQCELCNQPKPRLHWHHWDNEHLEYGLWLCGQCHLLATWLEHYDLLLIKIKYQKIKKERQEQVDGEKGLDNPIFA